MNTDQLDRLMSVFKTLGTSASQNGLDRFLQDMVSAGRRLLDAESCSFFRCDREPVTGEPLLVLATSDSEKLLNGFRAMTFRLQPKSKEGLTSYLGELFMRLRDFRPKVLNGDDLTKHPNNAGGVSEFLKRGSRALLAVPLRDSRKQLLGIVKLHNPGPSTAPRPFSPDDEALAEVFATYVSVLVEQKIGGDEVLLEAFSKLVNPVPTGDEFPNSAPLLRELARIVKADRVTLWRQRAASVEPEQLAQFVSSNQPEPEQTRSVLELVRWGLEHAAVADDKKGELVAAFEIPGGGKAALHVETWSGDRFNRRDRDLVKRVAGLLERAWQVQERERRTVDNGAGEQDWWRHIPVKHDQTSHVIDSLLRAFRSCVNYTGAALFVPDFSNGVLRCIGANSKAGPEQLKTHKYSFTETAITAHVWRTRKPYCREDWETDDEISLDGARLFGVEGVLLATPIFAPTGTLPQKGQEAEAERLGVLLAWGDLSENDLPKLADFAEMAAQILSKTIWLRGIQSAFEEMTGTLAAKPSTQETCAELRKRVLEIIRKVGFQRVRYFHFDSFGNRFLGDESIGMKDPEAFRGMEIHIAQSRYADQIVRDARVEVRARVFDPQHSGFGPDPDWTRLEKDLKTPWVVVPLVFEGKLFGQIAADAGTEPNAEAEQTVERLKQLEEYLTILGSFASWLIGNAVGQLRSGREVNFLGMALDCLRTPVHSVTGIADYLGQAGELKPGELGSWTKLLKSQTDRLVEFIKAMELTLAEWLKASNGTQSEGSVDLRSVVSERVEAFRPIAAQRDILLDDLHLPELDCEVTAGSDDLGKCLWELLMNAYRFSEPGQLIEIQVKLEATKYRIVVCDEGPGVPDIERERIFDAFVSIPRYGRHLSADELPPAELEGTGLGLYVARKIARRLGGELTCKNRSTGGAEFTIELPRPIL